MSRWARTGLSAAFGVALGVAGGKGAVYVAQKYDLGQEVAEFMHVDYVSINTEPVARLVNAVDTATEKYALPIIYSLATAGILGFGGMASLSEEEKRTRS